MDNSPKDKRKQPHYFDHNGTTRRAGYTRYLTPVAYSSCAFVLAEPVVNTIVTENTAAVGVDVHTIGIEPFFSAGLKICETPARAYVFCEKQVLSAVRLTDTLSLITARGRSQATTTQKLPGL
jgi:hypothetical protein